jgi:hypothetical protein
MKKPIWLLLAVTLTLSACGSPSGVQLPSDPNAPVLQIRSEGGFAPIEWTLGRGPRYTLLADGRLIHEGPTIAIFPGPLLPNYLVSETNVDQMNSVIDLIQRIGLPDMGHVVDDSQSSFVADATTEVVTFWDDNGEHSFSVYALELEPDPSDPKVAAFADLLVVMDQLAFQGDSTPFEASRVRITAGAGFVDPEFEDVREWPLDNPDFSDWSEYPNGWTCEVFGPEVLDLFLDATQSTTWLHPNPMMDAPSFKLLVRPLYPGEPDCANS